MNKERILALADLIEKQPHTPVQAESGFNMADLVRECGTPACIAGWAAWEEEGRPAAVSAPDTGWCLERKAQQYLGLAPSGEAELSDTAYSLFYPEGDQVGFYDEITPAQAAACLRHLAETGEVDWDHAMGVAA